MVKNKKRMLSLAAVLVSICVAAALAGCSGGASGDTGSDGPDVSEEVPVSSAEPEHIPADSAVSVLVDGEKDEEIFLLRYVWYGEEFASEDSFQKIMMTRYMPKGNHAPTAAEDGVISFVFDESEGAPSEISVMQLGNTVRSDSGLPYDTVEPELTQEGNTFRFSVKFRRFVMYYYYLDCQWENGNELHCGFAIEKAGSFSD